MQSGAADPGRFVLAGPRVGKSSEYDSLRSPPGRYVQSGAGLLWCGGDKTKNNARVRTEMVNVDVKKKTLIRTQQRRRVDINDYEVLLSRSLRPLQPRLAHVGTAIRYIFEFRLFHDVV